MLFYHIELKISQNGVYNIGDVIGIKFILIGKIKSSRYSTINNLVNNPRTESLKKLITLVST